MISFYAGNKTISVFPAVSADRPVIYLHTFEQTGQEIFQILQHSHCTDFTLVAISGLDWNNDMTPWPLASSSEKGSVFTGGADTYLELLTRTIIPETEQSIPGCPVWRGIAGYSLAGLFALYSLYRTDLFSRAASMSGSLWYPGIKEYVFSHQMKTKPDCIYFSLGSKENKTRNQLMKNVRQNTEEIVSFCENNSIQTVFQLNPGNHFSDTLNRSAAGIEWLLSR